MLTNSRVRETLEVISTCDYHPISIPSTLSGAQVPHWFMKLIFLSKKSKYMAPRCLIVYRGIQHKDKCCHWRVSISSGEPLEGKHKQWDPTSLCSEHLCPKHFSLGLEIHKVEPCGSDKWQIDLHDE